MKREEEKIPDFLRDLKKENPFKVPSGYFENFSRNLADQIQKDHKSMVKAEIVQFRKLRNNWLTPWTIAATFLLGFAGIWWIIGSHKSDSQYVMNISPDEARVYIMANPEEFDEFDFSPVMESPGDFLLESFEEIDPQELMEIIQNEEIFYLEEDI